jgi:2-isopropylmalate synthase
VLVLCETNGGCLPHEIEDIVRQVQKRFPEAKIGIHTHDDGGVGVANTLAAIRAGAMQVQGTMNGYGERTGNCNLTTVIPNLQLKMGIPVVPDLTKLTALSKFVDDVANLPHFNRAPFVGSTAFSHKGGTHVNAVQKLARSYEHVVPGTVGNHQIVLVSDMSGQDNILRKAKELGFDLKRGEEVRRILDRVKQRENDGYEYEAADASFELLLRRELGLYEPEFQLLEYHVSHRQHGERGLDACEATVKIALKGERIYTVEEGDGPVNALDRALRKALATAHPELRQVSLCDYKVRILTDMPGVTPNVAVPCKLPEKDKREVIRLLENDMPLPNEYLRLFNPAKRDVEMGCSGTASKTRVLVESTDGTTNWGTVGVDYNIIDASWEALRESLEYFLARRSRG